MNFLVLLFLGVFILFETPKNYFSKDKKIVTNNKYKPSLTSRYSNQFYIKKKKFTSLNIDIPNSTTNVIYTKFSSFLNHP